MDDKKSNVKSVLDDTSVTKVIRKKTESSNGSASNKDSRASNELFEPKLTAESDSDLTPETTSSESSILNQAYGKSCDTDLPSFPKEASSTDDVNICEKVKKVHFAASPDAAASSESPKSSKAPEVDNNLTVSGTSVEQTIENTTTPAEPENLVERSGEIVYGCCPEHRGFLGYFRISMMYLRESKLLLPFLFLLLSLPVSSGFMGAKYMEKCPVSPAIPLLLFMMGILGTVVICSRIYSIFKKTLFPNSDWSGQVRSGLVSGLLMLSILYTTELACFFIAVPSFKQGSLNYCHETFYSFAFYINYIIIALVILLLVLHCPGSHQCSSIGTP